MRINNTVDFINSQNSLRELGAKHIGYQVGGWRIGNDICVPHDEYLRVAKELGIEGKFLVEPKTSLRAFRAAIAQAKLPKGLKLLQLKEVSTDKELVYALYRPTVKGADTKDLRQTEVSAEHKMNLLVKPGDKPGDASLELIAPAAVATDTALIEECNQYYQELMSLYKRNSNVVRQDIGETLSKFCNRVGVATQPRGGSYFIPKEYDTTVDALSQLIDQLSTDSNFVALPCYASPNGDKALKKQVIASINAEIEAIDVEAFRMIAPITRLMECDRLVDAAIAARTPGKQIPILEKLYKQVAVCRSLGVRVKSLMDDAANGHVVYSEAVDELTKIKEMVQPKQRTNQSAIANDLDDIKTISEKVNNFQIFLESESDRFKSYLNELATVLRFKMSGDITASAELAGIKLPATVPTAIAVPDDINLDEDEDDNKVGF